MKLLLLSFLCVSFVAQCNSTEFSVREDYFINDIDIDIYTRTWEPVDREPIANVVFVHGQAEHVYRYNHVFSEFAKAGLKVHGFDQVGCGRTGLKSNNLGGAMGMARVRIDIDDAIERVYDPETPLFLMGHSFGGATVIDYLARGNKRDLLYGAVASAPDLELSPESKPNLIVQAALRAVVAVTPMAKVPADLDLSYLSRNATEVEIYKNDPLIFSKCAAVQVYDTVFGGEYILKGGYKNINIPRLLIVHGSSDKITSPVVSNRLYRELQSQGVPKNLDFILYPGAYHELHNDLNKREVISNHIKWILSQL
ncbi:hypothetical protein DSO57_1023113 [Entomophthora muscae]|uniref:Uncharacterized protein n=1 Tax=Entomophthora muscae TaxID=34485 RepID=A0ACC2TDZ0_9FUNG|nr:hypothetical protein DSO57_1023113 [Entomophthora muscae]